MPMLPAMPSQTVVHYTTSNCIVMNSTFWGKYCSTKPISAVRPARSVVTRQRSKNSSRGNGNRESSV